MDLGVHGAIRRLTRQVIPGVDVLGLMGRIHKRATEGPNKQARVSGTNETDSVVGIRAATAKE
jgi:hypothetical protein